MNKMTKRNQIYRCEVCGNVVEVVNEGVGELVCCGQPMKLLEAKSEEEGTEKHKPVIEREGNDVRVIVGSVEHPMEEKHFIELIELVKDDRVLKSRLLYPGDKPIAYFKCEEQGIEARAFCNVHGLWKN
jgi:superoxide reductase